jgi:hypothetical protein
MINTPLTESNKLLIPFLRELADSIEQNTIAPDQLRQVGEFFMAVEFQKQQTQDQRDDFSGNDLTKFLILGWYIYTILQKNEELPNID